ncbi:SGNH/GDSL hydrolase family protein [Acinetobacter higginsii]|uniref:SGNH/GDSL hydrolase family protein n=1 Tax=Acinetobacter higginsii TaxID=70347 RepID=UPI001F4AA6C6|nr:SGNH/GDSL hydrolase family protein [Acinetobacter higginsii]MCH7338186.1 SGNH/GDSL hydrolase family protein [Acinetobacter higginsii]
MAELPTSDEFINPNTTEAQFKAALKVLVENVSSVGYVDSFLKTVKTLPSGSTTAARTLGFHILPTNNTYTDLPPNIIHDDTIVIHVVQATGVFYDQVLYKLSARHRVWCKSIRVSDGSGAWRNPVNRYQGAFDNIDPMTLTEDGTYVLTNGKNLPSGFSGSAILDIDRAGGFTTRIIKQTNDSSKKWEKTEGEAWKEAMPFTLTNDRFPADYNFRGLVTDANYNNLNSEGNWLLNGSPTNGPSWITGTQYAYVKVLGSFRIQEALSASTANQIAQRTGQLISGTVNWGPWNKIGDNYKGLFTAVDIDTLNANGRYLVNGAYTNGAPFIIGTQFVDTAEYGTFRVQKATSVSSSDLIAQRTGTFGSGVVTWGPWNKFGGAGGGNSGSSLNGKTIANVGDSTTEQGDWIERLCERYGATPLKFGFGGCRMGRYESNMLGYNLQCMYNIAKCINTGDFSSVIAGAEYTRDNHNDDNTPQANALAAVNWNAVDILVISFGTNDWNGNPLGTSFIADPMGATFKGALCYVIEQIQSKYPHLQLVFVGMSYRLKTGATDPAQNSDDEPSTYGYLYEYQQAILEAAAKYHLPAYDFYKNSGVNRYTYTHYLRDGVHPKPISGYQHWANKIGSFLNSVI